MPVYEFKCDRGHRFDRFLKLANCQEPQTCECGEACTKLLSAPFIRPDIPAYVSPVTGDWVNSRRQRQEDLLRSNSLEFDPDRSKESRQRKEQANVDFDNSVDDVLEEAIARMPARKLETLEAEVRAGADAAVERSTPKFEGVGA